MFLNAYKQLKNCKVKKTKIADKRKLVILDDETVI